MKVYRSINVAIVELICKYDPLEILNLIQGIDKQLSKGYLLDNNDLYLSIFKEVCFKYQLSKSDLLLSKTKKATFARMILVKLLDDFRKDITIKELCKLIGIKERNFYRLLGNIKDQIFISNKFVKLPIVQEYENMKYLISTWQTKK